MTALGKLTEIEQLAVATALAKMLGEGFFSICTIDQIVKITGAIPDQRAYHTLRLLHCVNYADMPVQIRDQLGALIGAVICGEPLDLSAALARHSPKPERRQMYEPAPRKGLLRLFRP